MPLGMVSQSFTAYFAWAVIKLGHKSFENTACSVSHSWKVKLYVFVIPVREKIRAYIIKNKSMKIWSEYNRVKLMDSA